MKEQSIEKNAITPEELDVQARKTFEEKINSSVKQDFKIITRSKIENKDYAKAIGLMTGLSAALVVLGGAAGALLGPTGDVVQTLISLEAAGLIMGNLKAIFEMVMNSSLSVRIKKELKESGIEIYRKGLDIYVKHDENYVKYNNSNAILNIKFEIEEEKRRERELAELEKESRKR